MQKALAGGDAYLTILDVAPTYTRRVQGWMGKDAQGLGWGGRIPQHPSRMAASWSHQVTHV